MTKQEYIEKIDNFMADCPDIVLLDLILKILAKAWFSWPVEEFDSEEDSADE